jgi:hypothetical protein
MLYPHAIARRTVRRCRASTRKQVLKCSEGCAELVRAHLQLCDVLLGSLKFELQAIVACVEQPAAAFSVVYD